MNKYRMFLARLPGRIKRRVLVHLQSSAMPILLAWKVVNSFTHRRPGKQHGLPGPLIVSLTSYPARFGKLPLTLKCLLSQTVTADRIILWVAHQDKNALTPSILDLQKQGLQIAYCDDLRSFKKIIPTLQSYPDSFIVTADDDLYYWPTWLEELVNGSLANPRDVVCHRLHQIRLGQDGLPLPYKNWEMEAQYLEASLLNFQTGVGGVLYPPNAFHADVLKSQVFKKLCPNADDVWLYWMMRLNGAVARKVGLRRPLYNWPDTQQTALFHSNAGGGGNDEQIRAMIQTYGFPGEEP